MKKKRAILFNGVFILITFLVFLLLFTYSSLNLKSIDYGYKMQALSQQEKRLMEEIDKLKFDLHMIDQYIVRIEGHVYYQSRNTQKLENVP